MLPQEQFEYKRSWKPTAYTVRVHSDLDIRCKDYCRKHFSREEWSMDTYTDVYEHTFYFHNQKDSVSFYNEFKDWVNED